MISMKRKHTDIKLPRRDTDNNDKQKNIDVEEASLISSKRSKNHTPVIIPQAPQKTLGPPRTCQLQQEYTIQCWAHTKMGVRCSSMVSSREGEPVPIPYCDVHLKSGDGALKVVRHPIAGKCLVAR
jgi:hypothetical protein